MEERIRRALNDWRFWMGVAYFVLALVFVLWVYQHKSLSNETAHRIAIEDAGKQEAVASCYAKARDLKPTIRFMDNLIAIAENQRSLLANEPERDKIAIDKNAKTIQDLHLFERKLLLETPTLKSCKRLSFILGVK